MRKKWHRTAVRHLNANERTKTLTRNKHHCATFQLERERTRDREGMKKKRQKSGCYTYMDDDVVVVVTDKNQISEKHV